MPISAKLAKFLSQNEIKFEEIEHRTVYTGLDKAATLRVKPSLIAKTIVVKSGKELAMGILAANRNVNKKKLAKVSKLKNLDFISEKLMKSKFVGFKVGALPPFGLLFKVTSFIDRGLAKEKFVYASSGNYEISLKISPKILEKLGAAKADFSVAKKINKFSLPKKVAKPKPKKNPPRRQASFPRARR